MSSFKNFSFFELIYIVLGQSILGKYIWIGGNDLARRNVWAWGSTGYRIYPYVNWLEGFPSISEGETSEAQCTLLDPAHGFQWISDSCGNINDNKHYFFCELYNDEVCLNIYRFVIERKYLSYYKNITE